MNLKLLALASVAACVSTPAFAQDAPDMSGFRLEAIAGVDRVSTGADGTEDFDSNDDGFLFGVGVGYDFAFSNFVVGVEAELTESTTGVSQTYAGTLNGEDVDGTIALDASEDIYVGARLGSRINRDVLFYLKAGYTVANAELSDVGTVGDEAYNEVYGADFDGFRLGKRRRVGRFFSVAQFGTQHIGHPAQSTQHWGCG